MDDCWSYKYLIDEKYEEDMYDTVSAKWRKTNSAISNLKISKEEKKMGEIKKDRITLDASEGCQLELFKDSNTIVFHFGTESRAVTVPDDYEINCCVRALGLCDLQIVKKKPKLLNMKFTVKACPIFRKKYANTTKDICDSAISFPEPYAGEPLHLNIRDGIISTLSSDPELRECLDNTKYTVDDIPLIERKIREAYNTRKIFPNATNGIEIIREEGDKNA